MASVTLEFLTPLDNDIVALRVYEAGTSAGPFNQIERTTAVGVFPTYIRTYTSALAAVATDWFAIAWENAGGVVSPLSQPVQGGHSSLVGVITDRVMLRDPALNNDVVEQEAEFAIGDYFRVDPFSVDPDSVTWRVMRGLITMTLVRSYINRMISLTAQNKWQAGLVSMDTSTGSGGSTEKAIERMLVLANQDLNRTYSVILLLQDVAVAGGFKVETPIAEQISGIDVTRGILMVSFD
jgi:hypothetical protein